MSTNIKLRCNFHSYHYDKTCHVCRSIAATEKVNTGIKHDNEKPDMSLLSAVAITKIAEVMTFGKKKYSAHNWRGGFFYSRLLSATLRHVFAYIGGETIDPESGMSHLAHAACCLCMLLEFETTRPDLDDRYKPSLTKSDK